MNNILVAVDLNDSSQLLVEKAEELAQKFSSKVWVLHVADPDPDFVGNSVGPQYIRDFLAEELRNEHKKIQSYTKQLQLKGIQADGLLISGATVEMILLEIDKLGIDLVVIGRHEHSLMYKFFTGTTYSSIANKSKVPVLIVPL